MSRLPYKQCKAAKVGPEQQLVRHVSRWLQESIPTKLVWIGLDVPIGAGIPDVVAIATQERFPSRFRPHPLDPAILAFVRSRESVSHADISNQFASVNSTYLSERVACLASNGLLIDPDGLVELQQLAWDGVGELVTIEAKMSNWKIALRQAKRNQLFSTRSFVAMPKHIANEVAYRTEFIESPSVGVLAIDDDGEVDCIRPGELLSPVLWTYFYSVVLSSIWFPRGWSNAV